MSICHICLRTDRKVRVIDQNLSDLLDDLCDFITIGTSEYCSECTQTLRKFYEFKEKCILAVKVLKEWKKQGNKMERTPKELLYTKVPQSRLELCNIQNCKVYFFEEAETAKPKPKTPCLVIDPNKLLSCTRIQCDDIIKDEDIKLENNNVKNNALKQDVKCEDASLKTGSKSKTESVTSFELDNVSVNHKSDYESDNEFQNVEYLDDDSKKDENDFYNDENDAEYLEIDAISDTEYLDVDLNDTDNNNDVNEILENEEFYYKVHTEIFNTDNTDTEDVKTHPTEANKRNGERSRGVKREIDDIDCENEIKKYNLKKLKSETPKKEVNIKEEPDDLLESQVEQLKIMLKRRFDYNGDIKDGDGKEIDKELILNCLEKVSPSLQAQIAASIKDSLKFQPKAITLLSKLQAKYEREFDNMFTTEYLQTNEQIVTEFNKRKTNECYVKAKYKCTMCYKGFEYQKHFDNHLKTKHDESLPIVCLVCKCRFTNKKELYQHKIKMHRAVYKCKLCPLVTSNRSKSALSQHISNLHTKDAVCVSCAKTFVSPYRLLCHRTNKHKDEVTDPADGVTCETCDVTFVSRLVYEEHTRRTHTDRPTDPKASAKAEERRKIYMARNQRYVCKLCKSSGPNLGWLHKHFLFDHPDVSIDDVYSSGRNYLCELCGKGFSNVTSLTAHTHSHTGAKPYACPQCGARFAATYHLKKHYERHLPPSKPCEYCGKKFSSYSSLYNHKRIHYADRRYKCDQCDADFLFRGALTQHVRGVHEKIRRPRKVTGTKKPQAETKRQRRRKIKTEVKTESEA